MVEVAQEQVLLDSDIPEVITPEFVQGLKGPTNRFLCKLSDNTPKFAFKGFKIRDIPSNITLVDVPADEIENEEELNEDDDPTKRLIKYHLGPDFLRLTNVGLTMNFSIGDKPI